jgi:hypothetical protein
MAKVELLQPEIMKLSQELRREVAMAVKKFAWDAKYARTKYNSTVSTGTYAPKYNFYGYMCVLSVHQN